MSLTREQIVSGFNGLKAQDFDLNDMNSRGPDLLVQLTDGLMASSDPQLFIPELFRTMERLADSDLGSPGPLVHTLESLGNYEEELVRSVRRHPTYLSVWMVNRTLNGMLYGKMPTTSRDLYLSLLQESTGHPLANQKTREDALCFLQRFAKLTEQDQS